MDAFGRTGAMSGTEQVQQLEIARDDAGQSAYALADLDGLGVAEGQSQMVLPCPATGVEGRPRDVSDQVGHRPWQHVLRVEALGESHPHVETAIGDVPQAHR